MVQLLDGNVNEMKPKQYARLAGGYLQRTLGRTKRYDVKRTRRSAAESDAGPLVALADGNDASQTFTSANEFLRPPR